MEFINGTVYKVTVHAAVMVDMESREDFLIVLGMEDDLRMIEQILEGHFASKNGSAFEILLIQIVAGERRFPSIPECLVSETLIRENAHA